MNSSTQSTDKKNGGMLSLPAVDAQVRLWFIHQIEPESPVYNIYRAIRIDGELNVQAVKESVNALVVRQGALRTTFSEVDGRIYQNIRANLALDINQIDISNLASETQQKRLETILDEGVQQPFDLVKGPLIRVSLIKLSENEHVLFFCLHHLIFDRRSLGLLNKEFSDFYQFFSKGQSEGLTRLSVSYSDYTKWRLNKFNDEDLSKQWRFWEKNLEGIANLELPYDGKRLQVVSSKGDRKYLNLPSGLIENFEKKVSKQGATLFMGLLAVFKLLIFRWSGETDILTGTPFADRRLKGTENLFGFFVSTLILRTDLSENPTFTELLGRVRKSSFNSYRYHSMPLDKIIEKINPERIANRNPLFDLDFQFQKLQPEALEIGTAKISECRASRKSSQYDLGFTVREKQTDEASGSNYDIRFEYRTDLFSDNTIEALLKRFEVLLKEVTLNQDRKIADFSILLPEEKKRLLETSNETKLPYQEKGMHQYFIEQAIKNPNHVAVITEKEKFTYEEIANRAIVLAKELEKKNVSQGDVVGILLSRSEMIPVAMLATFYLGATYLPLDPEYPVSRIEYILNNASVGHVLLEESLTNLVTSTATIKIFPDKVINQQILLDLNFKDEIQTYDRSFSLDGLAYIIYTSGSTGNPKGVKLTQKNLVSFISSMAIRPGMTSDDILLAVTTISFDISVLEILLPMSVGATTIIVERDTSYDPEKLSRLLIEHKVTMMQATPATWQMMVASGWQGKQNLKLLTGGEALSQKLSDQLQALVDQVWNMYGPTETTVWSSCFKIEKVGDAPLIGKPIANTQIYILDSNNQPVARGTFGELCIAGDGVSQGYYGRSDLTSKVFIDNPFYEASRANPLISASKKLYKTGDMVRFNRQLDIEYVGRMDFQVKVRGYRIELGEIESAINKQKHIENVVVIVREDIVDDKRIVAYIIPTDHQFEIESLRLSLQDLLPSYMVPQNFVILEAFPQTPNGKTDRKLLPVPESDQKQNKDNTLIEPKSETEKSIAKIWSELSGQDSISIDSNFFEIGGHSLLAMQVISKAKKELGFDIKPMAMIQDTLAQIAASIDGIVYKKPDDEISLAPSVEPQFFGEDNSLFGFYYKHSQNNSNSPDLLDTDPRSKGAILLCSPILMENINANWAYRRLANQLSKSGYDVLRFDYFGTGDSLGYDSDASVERWKRDILSAARFLQTQSKHKNISMVGLRFGASLASMADVPFIRKLVLWEPIFNGDEYVEDLFKKYKTTLDDLNYIRKKSARAKKGELIGFGFSDNLEESIRNANLVSGSNLHNADKIILVSSNRNNPFEKDIERIKDVTLKNNESGEDKFVNCFVEDSSPGIEKYDDLAAFLPGKSLDVIIRELNEE